MTVFLTITAFHVVSQDVMSIRDSVATASVSDSGTEVSIVSRINANGSSVTVSAPEALLKRAVKVEETSPADAASDMSDDDSSDTAEEQAAIKAKGGKIVGYRVQVFADNNVRSAKAEARQRERAVSQTFPDYDTYVSYVSPYWRLRVGDFKSQYEAEKAAADLRKAFPRYAKEIRVVRDKVNIK